MQRIFKYKYKDTDKMRVMILGIIAVYIIINRSHIYDYYIGC